MLYNINRCHYERVDIRSKLYADVTRANDVFLYQLGRVINHTDREADVMTYWEIKEAKQDDELHMIRLKANKVTLDPLFKGNNRWPDEAVIRKLKEKRRTN